MFDDQTQPSSNPLNPIMPSPGMTPPTPGLTPPPPPPLATSTVHTMPERFRAAGGPPKGSSGTTKKLVIILIVVVVVGGLGFAGLYVFQNVLNKNNANTNTVVANTVNHANNNTVVNTANQNSSANVNSVGNLNSNIDTNTVSNGNLNTNTLSNSNANTNSSTVVTSPLPSSADTDHDGLTDVEEAVYGTDPAKADTDGDGFIDGKQVRADGTIVGELVLGYNPKGTGSLEASGIVKRVQDANATYSILIPTPWTATADQNGGVLVTPTQQTGEFFQLAVNDNPNRLAPKDWYRTNNPTANVDALTTFAYNGLSGIYSEDESTAYIFKDTKVYSILYNTGSLTQVNYRTTFDMIVRSFKLVAK